MVFEPSHKNHRTHRTRAESAQLDRAIIEAVQADAPVSLRGVYYRVVSAGAIPKTDAGYRAVGYRLKVLRKQRRVNYNDIVDGTRVTYRTKTYGSAAEAVANIARLYRQELWSIQRDAVIVVSEKDAISGVVSPIVNEWAVPLIVLRGYSSISANYSIATEIANRLDARKQVFVYQLGDHDASGTDAWKSFQQSIRELLATEFDYDFPLVRFERIAVNLRQIEEMGLPTRPGKRTDTRAAAWGNLPNVEVDAIPAAILRQLVNDTIAEHIDPAQLDLTLSVERAEKEKLSLLHDLAA